MDTIQHAVSQAVEQLLGRAGGPLHLRLFLQPIVAAFLAYKAGRRDAAAGEPAFLWGLFSHPEERSRMLGSAWKDVGKIFVIALALDTVYQLIVFRTGARRAGPDRGLRPRDPALLAPARAVQAPRGRRGSRRRALTGMAPKDAVPEGTVPEFRLLGGPLHRLADRLGLVRAGRNTAPFGLAIGLFLWVVGVLLRLVEGRLEDVFSISMIGVHVRLLVVIPCLFVAEGWAGPRWTTFVETIVKSRVVRTEDHDVLAAAIRRVTRWTDSWWPDLACLVLAVLFGVVGSSLNLPGSTSTFDPTVGTMPLSAAWYFLVCVTVFRFLLLRWLCRFGLWVFFLWRLTRLDLDLVPTHPDFAGGLGYLEVVHTHFLPLSFAISSLVSASYAEEIAAGRTSVEGAGPIIVVSLVAQAIVLLGPLFIVSPELWTCRVRGLSEYMEFGTTYVTRFDRKWLRGGAPPDEPLLGTGDLQSLADLGNSLKVASSMRWVPLSLELVRDFAVAALLPILPLLLLEYPVTELARKVLERVLGA